MGDALCAAVRAGDLTAVKAHIATRGLPLRLCYDTRGRTPLHVAAETRNEAMVQLLLEGGARATAVDPYGYSVLDAAAPHVGISARLVEQGAAHDHMLWLLGDTTPEYIDWVLRNMLPPRGEPTPCPWCLAMRIGARVPPVDIYARWGKPPLVHMEGTPCGIRM